MNIDFEVEDLPLEGKMKNIVDRIGKPALEKLQI